MMITLFTNCYVFTREGIKKSDVMLDGTTLRLNFRTGNADRVVDLAGAFIFPGFADVHVHFREPGFSYKETSRTGTSSAARGGYTAVCTMPNLKPVPSTLPGLQQELALIERDALIHVYPVGAITLNQNGRSPLAHIEEIAPYVSAFSDDGKGIQEEAVMLEAMKRIAPTGKVLTAHCEAESELLPGGCIHDGEYARLHGHIGINSKSEYLEVGRDIRLAGITGVHLHVCHVSTKESVELIRKGKNDGVNVTAETAPHYLIFTDNDIEENGDWKMNPPIRSADDRHELLCGIKDGTIDCIITDHAPHSAEEKSRGLDGSAFGIVGLETCFAAMYTNLVLNDPEGTNSLTTDRPDFWNSDNGAITLEKLLELMCVNPRKVFGLPGPQYIEDGCTADFVIMDIMKGYTVDADKFLSKGRSTPFNGRNVRGETVATYVGGVKVYDRGQNI